VNFGLQGEILDDPFVTFHEQLMQGAPTLDRAGLGLFAQTLILFASLIRI
jgi:hypothetical protein